MAFANGKAIHGFNHGITPVNVTSDLWHGTNGGVTIQTGAGRFGNNSLRTTHTGGNPGTPANTTFSWALNSSGGVTGLDRNVASVYTRYITKPASGQISHWTMTVNGGSNLICRLDAATGHWIVFIGTGTVVDTGITPVLNTWYRWDIIYRMDLNPRTATIYITKDGDASYSAQVNCIGPTEATTLGRWFVCGDLSGDDQVCEYSDLLISNHSAAVSGDGDFPIVPAGYHHRVVPVFPASDGAHSVGSATFRYTDNNGSAYTNMTNSTTDSWTRVDDWPPKTDGDAADDWVEKSVGTTAGDLVLWNLGVPSAGSGTPIGVHYHTVLKATTAGAGSCELYNRIAGIDDVTQINVGTVGSTTSVYRGMCYPVAPNGTSWTSNRVAALSVRHSSTIVSPVSQVKAVMAEIAFLYSVQSLSYDFSTFPKRRVARP